MLTCADLRMKEWGVCEQSRPFQASVRRVLSELHPEALLSLKDPKLEVRIVPDEGHSVWAYFPVHRRRWIARELRPKPETRVLLVFSTAGFRTEPAKMFQDRLRDHLGHVLLYLRSPKAPNDCPDAQKEWRRSRSAAAVRRAKRRT